MTTTPTTTPLNPYNIVIGTETGTVADGGALAAETARAIAAEAGANNSVANEATTRAAADTQLSANIASEATARAAGDATNATAAAAALAAAHASVQPSAIGTTIAPLASGVVPPANLPAATTDTQGAMSLSTAAAQAPVQSVAGLSGSPTVSQMAATLTGIVVNTLAAGNDARIVGALQKANNFSDIASPLTAAANISAVHTVVPATVPASPLVPLSVEQLWYGRVNPRLWMPDAHQNVAGADVAIQAAIAQAQSYGNALTLVDLDAAGQYLFTPGAQLVIPAGPPIMLWSSGRGALLQQTLGLAGVECYAPGSRFVGLGVQSLATKALISGTATDGLPAREHAAGLFVMDCNDITIDDCDFENWVASVNKTMSIARQNTPGDLDYRFKMTNCKSTGHDFGLLFTRQADMFVGGFTVSNTIASQVTYTDGSVSSIIPPHAIYGSGSAPIVTTERGDNIVIDGLVDDGNPNGESIKFKNINGFIISNHSSRGNSRGVGLNGCSGGIVTSKISEMVTPQYPDSQCTAFNCYDSQNIQFIGCYAEVEVEGTQPFKIYCSSLTGFPSSNIQLRNCTAVTTQNVTARSAVSVYSATGPNAGTGVSNADVLIDGMKIIMNGNASAPAIDCDTSSRVVVLRPIITNASSPIAVRWQAGATGCIASLDTDLIQVNSSPTALEEALIAFSSPLVAGQVVFVALTVNGTPYNQTYTCVTSGTPGETDSDYNIGKLATNIKTALGTPGYATGTQSPYFNSGVWGVNTVDSILITSSATGPGTLNVSSVTVAGVASTSILNNYNGVGTVSGALVTDLSSPSGTNILTMFGGTVLPQVTTTAALPLAISLPAGALRAVSDDPSGTVLMQVKNNAYQRVVTQDILSSAIAALSSSSPYQANNMPGVGIAAHFDAVRITFGVNFEGTTGTAASVAPDAALFQPLVGRVLTGVVS